MKIGVPLAGAPKQVRRLRRLKTRRRLPGRDPRWRADDTDRGALLPRIHDRMTESVVPELADAGRLFTHVDPRPMIAIDVLGGGRNALSVANRELGLALSDDEIDYLADNFARIGRNQPMSSS